MSSKTRRFCSSKIKSASVVIIILTICIASYLSLSHKGQIYIKSEDVKQVYEFIIDMDGDGDEEKVKYVNTYYFSYQENISDSEHTSNQITIYVDDIEVYSDNIITLNALINPEVVDLVENNLSKKHLYVHTGGGGPALPMDYYFVLNDKKIEVRKISTDI